MPSDGGRPRRVHRVRTARALGHETVLAGLWRAAARDRLPHAFLFEGPEGIGKYLAAEELVRGLDCSEGPGPPCGACGPCRRLASGNHGDLHVLDVRALKKGEIKICYVTTRDDDAARREMEDVHDNVHEFLSLRPAEGGWRAVLVRDAHLMNESAQNALLKDLEEPGSRTLLVLVTGHSDRLLETIRSRCVRVGFAGVPRSTCEEILRDHELDPDLAARLARWTGGAPGRALELAGRGARDLVPLCAAALSGEMNPLVAARVAAEVDGDFLGDTDSRRARHRAQVAVELALEIVADALRAHAGVPREDLRFGAELPFADGGPAREARLRATVDALLTARQDVDMSMNADGILDRAFLALGRSAPARRTAGGRR